MAVIRDKSTKFFHNMVESKARVNSISELQVGDKIKMNMEKIKDHMDDFYKWLYYEEVENR